MKLLTSLFSRLAVAVNTAAELVGFNDSTGSVKDGEWLLISPYGEFPNAVGLQKLERTDAEAMVTAFKSPLNAVQRLTGINIYAGHPIEMPDKYTDRRRYGKIIDLAARAEGFFGLVALNTLGKGAVDDGQFTFPSAVWTLRRDGKFVRPTKLRSVGLTNEPNIPGEPWAKNENDTTMQKHLLELLVALGLVAANEADETKINTAAAAALDKVKRLPDLEGKVATLESAATVAANEKATLIAERDGLKTKLTKAESDLVAANTARAERETEIAVNEGRITQAERTDWNTRLTADFATNVAELNKKTKAAVNTRQQSAGLGSRKSEAAGNEKMVAINEAVAAFATANKLDLKNSEQYHRAYCAVKQSKPELFAAN